MKKRFLRPRVGRCIKERRRGLPFYKVFHFVRGRRTRIPSAYFPSAKHVGFSRCGEIFVARAAVIFSADEECRFYRRVQKDACLDFLFSANKNTHFLGAGRNDVLSSAFPFGKKLQTPSAGDTVGLSLLCAQSSRIPVRGETFETLRTFL